jgi:endonuclease/exonuclease/phosphatase family metal-dependent hydrolase
MPPNILTVMTQNMYVGTDFSPIFGAVTSDTLKTAVADAYANVQASNIPERAAALADEIVATQPDVIGLQEVSLWRTGPAGGPATTVTFDALQSLLDALAQRGAHYRVLAVLTNFTTEAPSALGLTIGFTDRDVVLARSDLLPSDFQVSNVQTQHFTIHLILPNPLLGSPPVPRGWIAVDGTRRGTPFRFVTTHLEDVSVTVRLAQAIELIQGPLNTTAPVVIAGDFNVDAASHDLAELVTYRSFLDADFDEAWPALVSNDPGFTWPLHRQDPFTPTLPSQRIDLVLFHGALTARGIDRIGETAADRTPSGLSPSDHAGVVASFQVGP